jgi:hypothetical protein
MSDDRSRCVVLTVPVEQSDNIEEAKARVRTKHLAISHPRRLCAVLSTEGWPAILWKADANGRCSSFTSRMAGRLRTKRERTPLVARFSQIEG